jgi:hypothetical protein
MAGRRMVYIGLELLHLVITFLVARSFTERPEESNSIEHQLSVVNWWTKRRILIMSGVKRTSLRQNWPGRMCRLLRWQVEWTRSIEHHEGIQGLGGRKREMLPGLGVVWFDALDSATHFMGEEASGALSCWTSWLVTDDPMSHARVSKMEMWSTAAGRCTSVAEQGWAPRVAWREDQPWSGQVQRQEPATAVGGIAATFPKLD